MNSERETKFLSNRQRKRNTEKCAIIYYQNAGEIRHTILT